jgi:hypothetical protein
MLALQAEQDQPGGGACHIAAFGSHWVATNVPLTAADHLLTLVVLVWQA